MPAAPSIDSTVSNRSADFVYAPLPEKYHEGCVQDRDWAPMPHPWPTKPVTVYRHNGDLAYVPTAKDYEEALDIAQDAFPTALGHAPRHLVSFSVRVLNEQGEYVSIRITPGAWTTFMALLQNCIFVDIALAASGTRKSGGLAVPPAESFLARDDGLGKRSKACVRADADARECACTHHRPAVPPRRRSWWRCRG